MIFNDVTEPFLLMHGACSVLFQCSHTSVQPHCGSHSHPANHRGRIRQLENLSRYMYTLFTLQTFHLRSDCVSSIDSRNLQVVLQYREKSVGIIFEKSQI